MSDIQRILIEENDFVLIYDVYLNNELIGQDIESKELNENIG